MTSLCGKYKVVVPIDGKTICGAYKPEKGVDSTVSEKKGNSLQYKLHMISAWAASNGISLGQVKVNEKSNEITAIPELINALDLEEYIITIDAMGCQKTIAKTIIDKKADYILSVKANHRKLRKEIQGIFDELDKLGPDYLKYSKKCSVYTTAEKAHDRIEKRECIAYYNGMLHYDFNGWEGIKTIARILQAEKKTSKKNHQQK